MLLQGDEDVVITAFDTLDHAVGSKRARSQITELSLFDVAVVAPSSPLSSLLSGVLSTRKRVDGIRFGPSAVKGEFVEEAYIYRMKRKAA